jgi:hypothetical protein
METELGALALETVAAVVVVSAVLRWAMRCRHVNPHYVKPVCRRDPVTGADVVAEQARYACYDCGASWPATVRDPAWAPVPVKQVFSGRDEEAAARAAVRSAIVDEQRKILAGTRTIPSRAPAPARRRGNRHRTNVTEIHKWRPA